MVATVVRESLSKALFNWTSGSSRRTRDRRAPPAKPPFARFTGRHSDCSGKGSQHQPEIHKEPPMRRDYAIPEKITLLVSFLAVVFTFTA
jgi:hypothetical protein